jgi:7-cyano-7-deazaguanine synthase
MNRDVVVLLSGGVDSAACAYLAHRGAQWRSAGGRLHSCVFVDYAQPAMRQEERAALLIGEALGVEVVTVQVNLNGTMAEGVGAKGPRVLPGRNLAFLARAMNYAACNGAREVWFGAIRDDDRDYPDCRHGFVGAVDGLGRATLGVGVRTPLIGMSKGSVLALASALGVPLDSTWSCYEPDSSGVACGTCNSCVGRNAA